MGGVGAFSIVVNCLLQYIPTKNKKKNTHTTTTTTTTTHTNAGTPPFSHPYHYSILSPLPHPHKKRYCRFVVLPFVVGYSAAAAMLDLLESTLTLDADEGRMGQHRHRGGGGRIQ